MNWGSFLAGVVAAEWAFALALWLGIGIGKRAARKAEAAWVAEKTAELDAMRSTLNPK